MGASPLRILFIEDSAIDVELEERELRKSGFEFESHRVEERDLLLSALSSYRPHLIISDFSLPGLDGMNALRLARENAPEIPFIFCSGTIGEDRAIESLKNGATDYVVKGRPGALPLKVARALREAQDRANHRRIEEQLRQAQKMEAVGRLAGGVAHDFNNLLTVINGYAAIILNQLPAQGVLRGQLEEILRAGERAASLTRQLLTFSRRQVLEPRIVNLNQIAAQMEKMLRRLIGEDVELNTELEPALGSVRVDPGQIEQVIMNLAVNARDAMPAGGRILLRTANVLLDEPFVAQHPGCRPGAYVELSVSDTGTGMDAETRSHLFEPFFTTKEPGKGTGLGLSTVYGIVQQAGGSIWVQSELSRGTAFTIYLPRIEAQAPAIARSAPASPDGRGQETVLVVEDSESLRRLAETILLSRGYRILGAGSAEEALEILSRHGGAIELLITDVVLPRMSGTELAVAARKLRPGLRTLFMSGYSDRGVVESGILEAGGHFLQKPFSPGLLLSKVREVLVA